MTRNSSVIDLIQYKFEQAERDLRLKLVEFSERAEIQAQIGEAYYIWKKDPDAVVSGIGEEDLDDLTFTKFFDWFLNDFRLLDSGKRVIEWFGEEVSRELTDAEKGVLGGWMENFSSFFEVESVSQKAGCRIRDIFTGAVYDIKDASSSEKISVGNIIAARPVKTGENFYFSGVIMVYPLSLKPVILDFFQSEFREYRKIFGIDKTAKEFLKDWGFLISRYAEETAKNPKFLTPEGDALVSAVATYRVQSYETTLEMLRDIPSLQEIAGGTDELRHFSWRTEGKNRIWGSAELEPATLTVECYSESSLAKAKRVVDEKLGGAISHLRDEIKPLNPSPKPKSAKKAKPAQSGGKSKKTAAEKEIDDYYDKWITKPLDDLNGLTPKEAAATIEGRRKLDSILVELEDLYAYSRERGEPNFDVRKLRRKLGIE